ncbi:MAG: precorrin-6A/cobalt-precorrin-6A reductase, partial [Bacteroides sp.]
MILILGGTTEGRIAASIVDEGEKTFYYSTKGNEQEIALKHGVRLAGALDKKELIRFCREKEIRLIIDAAHPFAKELHDTVYYAADELNTPVIRYERIYPKLDTDVDGIFQHLDYDGVMSSLREDKV